MPPQAPKPVTKADIADAARSLPDRAMEAAKEDRPITVTLLRPIEHGNTLWTKLEFEPMCGEHVEDLPLGMEGATLGNLMRIGGRMSGAPDGLIRKLRPQDIRQVCDVVNAFLLLTQSDPD